MNETPTPKCCVPGQKFELGRIVATPGALALAERINEESIPPLVLLPYLGRHARGDWGDLGDFDKSENDYALEHDLRILSAYNTPAGKLWIITERDRSATTFLLPSEY